MVEKEYVTWREIEEFVEQVAQRYAGKGVTGVYGPPRGGLVFAVILSHRLNIPMLMSPVPGCVIIDDICDSGESLVHYAKCTSGQSKPNYHIVTMYYKENALGVEPEYYMREKGDNWVVYPWEERWAE